MSISLEKVQILRLWNFTTTEMVNDHLLNAQSHVWSLFMLHANIQEFLKEEVLVLSLTGFHDRHLSYHLLEIIETAFCGYLFVFVNG